MSIWIFSFWSASKHLQGIKIYEISHQYRMQKLSRAKNREEVGKGG